jgi:hypothetical protein
MTFPPASSASATNDYANVPPSRKPAVVFPETAGLAEVTRMRCGIPLSVSAIVFVVPATIVNETLCAKDNRFPVAVARLCGSG